MSHLLMVCGLISVLTPLWYPGYCGVLFWLGRGPQRNGIPRRMNVVDWLNATGCGVFAGSVLIGVGRALLRD